MSGMGMDLVNFSSSVFFTNWTSATPITPYVTLMNDIFTLPQIVTLITIFGIFMIFGMFANATTFIVIYRMKKTPFNVFIMSLCVSDFLSALNSPIMVYRALKAFDDYDLPEFFCKSGVSIDYWTTIATIQHILAFSFLRLYCIKFPTRFTTITVKGAVIAVACIWMETFLVGFVLYVLWPAVQLLPDTNPPRYKCGMTRQWAPIVFRYAMIAFPILIYAPMILIILSCLGVCVILLRRRRKTKIKVGPERVRKEKLAVIQLALIVVSFLIGYSADVSYRVTAISSIQRGNPITARTEVIFSTFSHFILRLSECLNPIFYNFASSELRAATKAFFFGKCGRAPTFEGSSVDKSDSNSKVKTESIQLRGAI